MILVVALLPGCLPLVSSICTRACVCVQRIKSVSDGWCGGGGGGGRTMKRGAGRCASGKTHKRAADKSSALVFAFIPGGGGAETVLRGNGGGGADIAANEWCV